MANNRPTHTPTWADDHLHSGDVAMMEAIFNHVMNEHMNDLIDGVRMAEEGAEREQAVAEREQFTALWQPEARRRPCVTMGGVEHVPLSPKSIDLPPMQGV